MSKHAVRKRTGGIAALAAALTSGAVVATTLGAGPAAASVPDIALRAGAQCAVANPAQASDAAAADAIMRGRATIGQYGTYALAKDPTWRAQSTLDRSGNANVHGFTWLLPLLREGVRRHDTAMINRFYGLLADWRHDVRPQRLRSTGPYSALPEAQRIVAISCALAGPGGQDPRVVAFLREQAALMARADHWQAINNTSLQQAAGLWVAGYVLGDTKIMKTGLARIDRMSRILLLADGSDREGSTQYAAYNYQVFTTIAARLRAGGARVPASVLAASRIPSLLAAATRPDGKLEALGDAVPAATPNLRGTEAEYAATSGRSGPVPSRLFSSFAGGYVFDRSGWGTGQRAFSDETFWSLRTGGASARALHGHADAGSVTLASHGSQLLFDSGLYRYTDGAARRYVVGRRAHDVVGIPSALYRRTDGVRVTSRGSTADGDWVTLTDPGYDGYLLTRTVYYDRGGDYLLVWDTSRSTTSAAGRPRTAEQNWQLGRDRVVRTATDGPTAAAWTEGPGANLSLRWVGPAPHLAVTTGQSRPAYLGWNSSAYGELAPAPTLTAAALAATGTWLTVVVPRADGVTDDAVAAAGWVGDTEAEVTVSTGSVRQQVHLTRSGAVRTDLG
ncbi:MAG TPA: heparinase II/III family protein [Motilibacteraceae bacterium]|nr:heparinase II/III family protein [Motilibacteraceae bacterium]